MLLLIQGLLVTATAVYGFVFGKDLLATKKAGMLNDANPIKCGIIGFITDFFDTLGIGSFAPTVALMKTLKAGVADRVIPGTLNVSHTIPVVAEALIFTLIIEVEPLTLITLVVSAAVGSYLGAGIISKMPEKVIQIVMGVALLATAALMFLSLPEAKIGPLTLPAIGLMPGGGEAIGLTGVKLIIGIVGNFILGALMTAGIGLYAPCMALIYFLGMSAKVAFPIMMTSCALLMPVASIKFIKEGAYSRLAALMITILGTVGVFVAAFLVKSLPLEVLRWIVVVVILYTAITMLKSAFKKKTEDTAKNSTTA